MLRKMPSGRVTNHNKILSKMNKKRWIAGLAAVLLTVFAAAGVRHYRWSRLTTAEKAGTITEKMARHLDLNAGQKGKLYTINLEKLQAIETARQSGNHDRNSWKQLHEQWRSDVDEILTPEQRRKTGCHSS